MNSIDSTAQEAGLEFDKYELDPIGDVRKIGASEILTPVDGFDYIDVTRLKSYQPLGDLGVVREFEVVMEITVDGVITDGDDIYYMFIVEADSEDYMISYNNGTAEGQSLDDPFSSSFTVTAEGSGTDTLSVTLNLFSVNNPREVFDWTGLGMVLSGDQSDFQYMDKAPDKLLKATKPTDQGTVHSQIDIEGIIEPSITTVKSVEYQIDFKVPAGWSAVEDFTEGDDAWKFMLDTTRVEDEKPHEIHIRGTDGELFFEDTITLYVVQSNKDNPQTLNDLPDIKIGDTFDYTSTHDPSYMGLQLEVITDLTEKFVGFENVTSGSITYDAWRKELSGGGVVTYANIPIEFNLDGYSHVTKDKFEAIDSSEEIVINVPLVGGIDTTTESTYAPPLDVFNFPIVIGEAWESTNTMTSTTIIRFSGDYAEDSSDEDVEYVFEALHTEQTEVPAGTYETYVIRMQQKDSDMYQLDYYNPALGNNIRTESYDNNRELLERIDLKDYTEGKGGLVKIDGVSVSPENPMVEEKVTISVTLTNEGFADLEDNDIILEIDNKEYDMETIDLPSQSTVVVDFKWSPEDASEYILKITTPDDEWNKQVLVSKQDDQGRLGLSEGQFIIMLLIIILTVIIATVLTFSWRKKKDIVDVEAPRDGPSVFDMEPGGKLGQGTIEEPKVIRYQSGFSQVGGRTEEKPREKR